jgi:hypothetical protein
MCSRHFDQLSRTEAEPTRFLCLSSFALGSAHQKLKFDLVDFELGLHDTNR